MSTWFAQAVTPPCTCFAVENPALFRTMFGPERENPQEHARLFEAAGEGYGLLKATLERCQTVGMVRRGSSLEMSRVAWALVHGVALLILERPGMHRGAAGSAGW